MLSLSQFQSHKGVIMRRVLFLIVAFATLATSAYSQDRKPFGFGTDFNQFIGFGNPATINLVARVPGIKLPFKIGMINTSSNQDKDGDEQTTTSGLALTSIPQFVVESREDLDLYVGFLLGFAISSAENSATEYEDSDFSWALGPAVGSEYYFTKNFTLSTDLGISYNYVTNDLVDGNFASSTLGTFANLSATWYF